MTQATGRKIPLCMTGITPMVDRQKKEVATKFELKSATEKPGFTNTEEGACPVCAYQSKTMSELERMTSDPFHPMVMAKANGIDVRVCLTHNSVHPIPNEV